VVRNTKESGDVDQDEAILGIARTPGDAGVGLAGPPAAVAHGRGRADLGGGRVGTACRVRRRRQRCGGCGGAGRAAGSA
jgi:hypothetical protein